MLRAVTKEMVVDFRRDSLPPSLLHIGGAAVDIGCRLSIGSRTTRLRNSFCPEAVRLLCVLLLTSFRVFVLA